MQSDNCKKPDRDCYVRPFGIEGYYACRSKASDKNECPYMKLNTMEKLYLCMKDKKPEIVLDEQLRKKALKPILRMLEMS